MTDKPRSICIGEATIELARGADGRFSLGCAGDTFNTAIYLARAGQSVAFASALGDDAHSERIVALASAEGVATDLILRAAGRLPGLTLVEADAKGGRHANSWTDAAPARELFELPQWSRIAEAIDRGPAGLLFRHHVVALFQHRHRPLSRRRGMARSRAPGLPSTAISARAAGRAT